MIELIIEDSNLLITINTHECSTKPGLHLHILMDLCNAFVRMCDGTK